MNQPQAIAAQPKGKAWHRQSTEAVLAELASSADGLSAAEAAQRLASNGPNELQEGKRISPWQMLLAQPLEGPKAKKADRKRIYTDRARAALKEWLAEAEPLPASQVVFSCERNRWIEPPATIAGRRAPGIRWVLRAPCDWVNGRAFTQSLRRLASSGGSGCFPGEQVFFASPGSTPIPRLPPAPRRRRTCRPRARPLS